jgi:hypothetical protein
VEARLLRSFPTFGALFTCYYEGKGNGSTNVDGWAPHPGASTSGGVGVGGGGAASKGKFLTKGSAGASSAAAPAYGLAPKDEAAAMERTWRLYATSQQVRRNYAFNFPELV